MTRSGQSNTLPPLYKPERPNKHWQLGAVARAAGVSRDSNPFSYPGTRWEWEAGWDYENREIEAGR
jgi:ribosome modulation factor